MAERHTALSRRRPAEPVVEPAPDDRRFKDAAWTESALFDYIKQSYLLTARWMQIDRAAGRRARREDGAEGRFLHPAIRRRDGAVEFRADQSRSAARDASRAAARIWSTGLKNMLEDLERGKGRLMIKMTDMDGLQGRQEHRGDAGQGGLSRTTCCSSSSTQPTTETVKRRPLLIIPPWINKYYILDLRPRELLHPMGGRAGPHRLRRLLGQSRRALGGEDASTTTCWKGPLAALDAIEQATGETRGQSSSAIASAARCWRRRSPIWRRRSDKRVVSATYFASMVDFAEAGELVGLHRRGAARHASRSA